MTTKIWNSCIGLKKNELNESARRVGYCVKVVYGKLDGDDANVGQNIAIEVERLRCLLVQGCFQPIYIRF
jgi:hypothetical protein